MLNLRQQGLSLIELMIAIVIMGILLIAGAPNFGEWLQNQQIRTASESVLNGMQTTRSEAVKNNAPARFVLCGADSTWQVLAVSPTAPAAATADTICGAGVTTASGNEVRVQDRSGQEGSSQAVIAVTPAGANQVTFNSLGRVIPNADTTPSITQIDVSTATGTHPLRVTVGAGGNLNMCDPSPLLAASDPRHC